MFSASQLSGSEDNLRNKSEANLLDRSDQRFDRRRAAGSLPSVTTSEGYFRELGARFSRLKTYSVERVCRLKGSVLLIYFVRQSHRWACHSLYSLE